MTVQNRVDPVRIGEEIIYTIFHHIFHDEGARKHFGFSQINFFNNTSGLPGWNVWFEERSGAYQLVLVQAEDSPVENSVPPMAGEHAHSNGSPVEGRFMIRYFPDQNDPLLDSFSCAETIVRLGPLFDKTGTPNLSGQGAIDDSYFVVGYLDFRSTTNRDFVELDCIAPNYWKDVRIDGLYLDTPEDDLCEVVKPGEVDRDVPGWELAFDLFDKLITALGYIYKTPPSAAVLAHKKWIRFDIKGENCREIKDPDVNLIEVSVGIQTKPCCDECEGQILISPEAFITKTKNRLIAEDFQILETIGEEKEGSTPYLKRAWWLASRLKISSDMESDLRHCCYHDH